MLQNLHIQNLALIDDAEIEWTKGLNILTGETGAGKSVLLGSVNLALGEKADAALIRDGASFALIEMTFVLKDEEVLKALRERDVLPEADGVLLLQRKIMPGRSVCRIQGETVPAGKLRELADYLIHIHGQNDEHLLMQRTQQRQLLDDFAGDAAKEVLRELREAYAALTDARKKQEEAALDERERLREADLLRYEAKEIEEASLQEGEDETLEKRFRDMERARRTAEDLSGACRLLTGEAGAAELVSSALRQLMHAASGEEDETLSSFSRQLTDIDNLLTDLTHELFRHLEESAFSEEEYAEIADRLNLINHLKGKYGVPGGGIRAILREKEEKEERLAHLADLEGYLKELRRKEQDALEKAQAAAARLSALRMRAAGKLTKLLTEALRDLNFPDVQLQILVAPQEKQLSASGYDEVDFLISTNAGERLRPLQQVASGGELSRIMLAIRTVFAGVNTPPAMIFDEIDAGISGKTAWAVSSRLGRLAGDRQVICITHLPQIAAMADTHFLIYKEAAGERTVTRIRRLTEEESRRELARLLGTDAISEAACKSADEMRSRALQIKNGQNAAGTRQTAAK